MEARRARSRRLRAALRGPAGRRRRAHLCRGPGALRPRPARPGVLGRRLRAAGAAGGRVRGAGLSSAWPMIPSATACRGRVARASPGSGAGAFRARRRRFGANALFARRRHRRAQRPGAEGGARPAQGPADEGGADVRHRARPAAAGVRRTNWPSCRPTPRPWAAPSCAGAWPPSWARTGRRSSPSFDLDAGRRRLARPGAPRGRASTAAPLAVKLQYPEMQSAVESDLGAAARADGARAASCSARSTPARSPPRSASASARSSTTSTRPRPWRSTAASSPAATTSPRPTPSTELSTGRLLTMDWLEGRGPDGLQGRRPGDPQPHRAAAVRGLVDAADPHRRHPRRPAPRQLQLRRRGAAAAEPAGLRLHPHLPAGLRRRRGASSTAP